MSDKAVIYEKDDGIGIITLNRPEQRNAIGQDIMAGMIDAIDDIAQDKEMKVAIITGGEKVFAAGGDIKMFNSLDSPMNIYELSLKRNPVHEIEILDKPVIAAIAGLALGGGCELALSCDIRIAADNAVFGQPEINLGLMPGAGGTQRLLRLIGSARAKEMLFSGDMIDAQEAYRIGLVNKVVPATSLMDEARKLAKKYASKPPLALRIIKKTVNNGLNMDLQSALKHEVQAFSLLISTKDSKEGLKAFIEKRKPVFKGE